MGLLYDDDHLRDYGFNLDTIVHSEPIYSVRPAKRAKKQRQDPSYLHLELSFSSLGSDRDIQQFLNPDVVELPAPTNDKPKASVVPARSYRDAALSTIHEVPESSTLSLDLPTPEATDLPDLSSDSDGEEDEEEKKDDSHDWALLGDADVLSTADTDADIDAGGVVDSSSATGEAWIVLGDGS
ncbi:hypothetical protein F4677DRAFT_418288 [Hypoxylon crocopeplum]|nr:hypothetical protein F4677DRAFT_418288 [Hypoxylon crocopeplum]